MFGLEKAGDFSPRQLWGGMKMRVPIARALPLAPQLLLLDEPFGALDEMTRNRLNEELLSLRERSRFTALFVTHSVSEAVFLSNRVMVMAANPGRFHPEGRVDFPYPRNPALRERPEFQAKVNVLTPIIQLWIGPGTPGIITVTWLISFFPIVANTTQGLLSADMNHVALFRMCNASRWQEIFLLRVPAALPYFLTGLRIAAAL